MSKQNKEKKRQQIIGNIQLELFKVNVRKRERKTSPTEDSDRNLLKIGAQLGKFQYRKRHKIVSNIWETNETFTQFRS